MIQEVDPALGMAMNLSPDWPEMTKPHPTREEWEARQADMPPGMRALIEQRTNEKDAERAAKFARAEALAKQLRDLLTGFEVALWEVIAGNEWLEMYRVAKPTEITHAFGFDHRQWWAVFNFDAVGGYELWVEIPLRSVNGEPLQWRPDLVSFDVRTPRASLSAKTLAEAMDYATSYCATPF